ncbi:MAG: ABC transporter permease, partial [Cyclobacteriaceae bacterium]
GSLQSEEQRARLSAVYNIFAFAAMIPLIFIIPRLTSSVHPGSGGNPGFNMYDLDGRMRLVFYPAVIGWILLGYWIATMRIRIRKITSEQ